MWHELAIAFISLFFVVAIAYLYLRTVKTKNIRYVEKAKVSSKYIEGFNYLINDKPDKAVMLFQELLEVDSDMADVQLLLGNLFRKRGEIERATRIHQSLLLRHNLSSHLKSMALYELAKDYVSAGMLDRAEDILKELSKRKHLSEEALKLLLDIYKRSRDWHNAIKVSYELEKRGCADIRKDIANLHCELADRSYRTKMSWPIVENYLIQALKLDPDNIRANFTMAKYLCFREKYKESLEYFKQVASIEPMFIAEAIPELIECYESLGIGFGEHVFSDFTNNKVPINAFIKYVEWVYKEQGPKQAFDSLLAYIRKEPSTASITKIIHLLSLGTVQI